MKNWDKILDDFARKCKGGAPDMTNPRHLALLRESLLKFGWKEFATNEFIGNLRETKDKSDDSWWTKKTPAQQAKYIKDHPGSKKAKEVKKKEKGEEKKKPNNHQGQNLESIKSIKFKSHIKKISNSSTTTTRIQYKHHKYQVELSRIRTTAIKL